MEKQIKAIASQFLVHLGIDYTDVEVHKIDDTNFRLNVVSDSPNLLIGHHGENLLAMQKILKVVFLKELGEDLNIAFDVDNYRQRQEENVMTITAQKIEEARATQTQVALPAMSPYFRRLVHLFIRNGEYEDLETESMGEGNYRQVMIKPKA